MTTLDSRIRQEQNTQGMGNTVKISSPGPIKEWPKEIKELKRESRETT